MQNTSTWSLCEIVCCSIAAVIGLIAILVTHLAIGTLAGVLVGVALGVMLYFVFSRLVCTGDAPAGAAGGQEATQEAAMASETTPTAATAPAPAPEPEPAMPQAHAAASEPEPAALQPAPVDKAPSGNEGAVRSGVQLPGEQELAARKGRWTYRPDTTSGTASEAAPAPGPAEPDTGHRPEGLAAARAGGADDLKRIRGVGPKLEKLLHSMGYFHFDQIAAWGPEEVAWVDENLKGFRGRVSRDDWVAQARTLATGGQTEFSRRVDGGGVYE